MKLALFMASPIGRALRAVVGVIVVVIGLTAGSTLGIVLIALGMVFIAVGVFNVCLIGPIIGAPFSGKAVCAMKDKDK